MKANKGIIGYMLLLSLTSCLNRGKMTLQEYSKFMTDNKDKIQRTKTSGNLQFTLTILPGPYYVVKYHGVELSKSIYDSLSRQTKGIVYAELRISAAKHDVDPLDINSTGKSIRQQRIYYFSYDFQNDVVMKCGEENLGHPVLYNFIQSYGLAKELGAVMAFKTDDQCEAANLVVELEDNVYGNGRMKFSFDKKYIYSKPDLNFSL